jgi:hypothetical protein
MFSKNTLVLFSLGLALTAGAAVAQTTVSLPDTSQETTFSADVAEVATVTVPATVHFAVASVASPTDSAVQTVSATGILLATGKALKISLQANAADFTPPSGGTITWAATDVSWNNGSTWTGITGGAGSANSLSSAAYTAVATSDVNATTLSTASLVFTLAAKGTVDRAGSHTLAATWKFESI